MVNTSRGNGGDALEGVRESFLASGYVSGITVRDKPAADAVRAQWNELETAEGFRAVGYSTAHSRHLDHRFVWELAVDSMVLDAVETLIGTDILLFGTRFFCKYGDAGTYHVSWHQDIDSWALDPPVALTVWYAIDDSDEDNGCMRVLPGSHLNGPLEHVTSPEKENMLGRGQSVAIDRQDEQTVVPVVLQAGQISIHDAALLHASGPNRSTRRRCGLAMRYVPANVRQHVDKAKSPPAKPILLRGQDRHHHFGAHDAPTF